MEQIDRPPKRNEGESTDDFLKRIEDYFDRFYSAAFKGGPAHSRNVKTGTYTGDGTIGQSITGIGFEPKYVRIWNHPAAEANMEIHEKLDQTWGDYAGMHRSWDGNTQHYFNDSRINSLDSDGFTVDDDGADAHPNKDGQAYDYLAIG